MILSLPLARNTMVCHGQKLEVVLWLSLLPQELMVSWKIGWQRERLDSRWSDSHFNRTGRTFSCKHRSVYLFYPPSPPIPMPYSDQFAPNPFRAPPIIPLFHLSSPIFPSPQTPIPQRRKQKMVKVKGRLYIIFPL